MERHAEETLFARIVEAALKHAERAVLKAILRLDELRGRLLGAYLQTKVAKETPELKEMRKEALDLDLEMRKELGSTTTGKNAVQCSALRLFFFPFRKS